MIPADVLLLYFVACLLLAAAPGPDNLFALAVSIQHGAIAGLVLTGGLLSGVVIHTVAVAVGLAAVIQSSAMLFMAIKLLGAAYLLVLAWQAYRASRRPPGDGSPAPSLGLGRLYRRGVLMNIGNPKVSLFFLAFLPQFADAARGALLPQFLLLGAVFMVAGLLVFGALCLIAGRLGDRLLRSERAQRWLNRLAGMLFAGFACRLVLSQR